MKITPILFGLFFLMVSSLFAQEYDEKNVVAKGCEKFQDNLELKHCLKNKFEKAFRRKINKRLTNELKPGLNKFYLGIEIKADKKIELIYLNTPNPTLKKEFQSALNKIKIIQPGMIDGKAINVVFNLPLTMQSKVKGVSAIHKMTKIVDNNNYKGNEVIYPEIEAYRVKETKKENFKSLEKYIKNFFFNSVDVNKIESMLNPGMNFFEAKISYNTNDEITKITSLSNHKKLNAIFENHLSEVFEKSGFKSPAKDDISYAGEMTFYFFYMNP